MTNIPRPEYPRPQFVRDEWLNLNGTWTCEFDFSRSGQARKRYLATGFEQKILVPFCPESALSGIGYTDFIEQMYYHRKITVPASWRGKKILMHFGGVDYECRGYLDGECVGFHAGGSTSFHFDLTDRATPGKEQDFVLFVRDMIRDQVQPRGKQCPRALSSGCCYTRTTGIWQTVWLEPVDEFALKKCRIVPDLDNGCLGLEPEFFSVERGLRWQVKVSAAGKVVGEAEFSAATGSYQTVKLSAIRPWCPEDPFLYDLEFRVFRNGECVDFVRAYAGLRKIHIEGDKYFLNDRPLFLRFVLDQGFFPGGVWTAPTDNDLKRDIELAMSLGFNGARLHQKVFEPRYLYWADRLGYLVWGESPSWGVMLREPVDCPQLWQGLFNFQNEWREIVERDFNSPAIIAWSPTNEGVPGADKELFRCIIAWIYDATKRLDPTRPCNESSGYSHVRTDLWTVHCYRANAEEMKKDLGAKPVFMRDPEFERPAYHGQPYINDECGGFLYLPPDKTSRFADNTWGYYGIEIKTPEEFAELLRSEVECMAENPRCSGFCFTQLTDIEQEQNGVCTFERVPKAPVEMLRRAFTAGSDKRG